LLDKQVFMYRTSIHSQKWWWPLFTQFIDVTLVNVWRLFQISNPEVKINLLDVPRKIVLAFLVNTEAAPNKSGPKKSVILGGGRVSESLRYDSGGHFLSAIATQRRYAECGMKTKRICCRCDVPLHDLCFKPFHTK
jgi:hypothetical protein